jgi:hypothetical protein
MPVRPDYEQQAKDKVAHQERIAKAQCVVIAWGYTAFCDSLEAAHELLRQDAERGAKYGYEPEGVIFVRPDPQPAQGR